MNLSGVISAIYMQLAPKQVRDAIYNLYESARQFSTDRGWLPWWIKDPKEAIDQLTREEILRKAQWFEANSEIVNRLADVFEQYVVGAGGLRFIPSSSDQKWNRAAADYWMETGPYLDNVTQQGIAGIMSLAARTWFIQGECFILKTRGDSNRARIELIEPQRVATPAEHVGNGKVFDGIELDERGRRVAYWISTGLNGDKFTRYEADKIIHIFEPSRPGQLRGLSFLYPCMNSLQDLLELNKLEMKAAKNNADLARVVETPTGTFSGANKMREILSGQPTQKSDGTDTTKSVSNYYQNALGGRILATMPGHKVTEFRSDRPSAGVQWYYDYKLSEICAGAGISKLLVFPYSNQGTVVRADLDIQNTFFRARFEVVANAFRDVYLYVMEDGIFKDRRLADKPGDWRKVIVRPPRSVNVDVGRNSNALLEELKAHVRTYQGVYAELGEDWREQFAQTEIEQRELLDMDKRLGLPTGSMSAALQQKLAIQAQPQPQPQEP